MALQRKIIAMMCKMSSWMATSCTTLLQSFSAMSYCHGHDQAEGTTVFPIWPGTDVTYAECVIPNWEYLNRTSLKPKRAKEEI
jgi:hypothetical protein